MHLFCPSPKREPSAFQAIHLLGTGQKGLEITIFYRWLISYNLTKKNSYLYICIKYIYEK